mmetsp:Transcript_75092/g.162391  ORF Transcript_75092/g.162391 Transcript_75092/m.162391 type:complete len:857 (-) Transcript_75092:19-2589(-)
MKILLLLALSAIGAQCSQNLANMEGILKSKNSPQFISDERVKPLFSRSSLPVGHKPLQNDREVHDRSSSNPSKKTIRSIQRALEASKPYVDPDSKYNQQPGEDADAEKEKDTSAPPSTTLEDVVVESPVSKDETNMEESISPEVPASSDATEPKPAPSDAEISIPNDDVKPKPEPKTKPAPLLQPPTDTGSSEEILPIADGGVVLKPPPADGVKPKPAPPVGELLGAPNGAAPKDKPKPKPKPTPRTLLSLLGLQDGPGPMKPKPDPKSKPMPVDGPGGIGGGLDDMKVPLPFDMMMPMQPPIFLDAPTQTTFDSGFFMGGMDESDYDRTRAQMALVSSPHSSDYSDEAFITVSTVQDMCSSDFQRVCNAPTSISNFAVVGRGINAMGSQQLDTELSMFDAINGMLSSIFNGGPQEIFIAFGADDEDFDDDYDDDAGVVMPCGTTGGMERAESMQGHMNMPRSMGMSSSRVLHSKPKPSPDGKPKPKPEPKPAAPEHGSKGLAGAFGKPKPKPEADHHEYHGGMMGGVPQEEEVSDVQSRYQNTLLSVDPDTRYHSYLGFGEGGDMCLMDSYDELSAGCQSALDDAVALREDYIYEEEDSCHGRGVFVLLLVTGLVLLTCVCVKRRKMMLRAPRRAQMKATLDAIHADAELKAKVEAASGVPVPVRGARCEGSEGPCKWRKVLTVVATICLSFLIVRIAAGATMQVANSLVQEQEDGSELVPSPIFVLLIFISFLAIELLVLVGIKKAVDFFHQRRAAARTPPTASSGTQPSSGGESGGLMRYMPVVALPRMPTFFRRGDGTRGSYQPLMCDDESNTELITHAPSAPQQHLVYVPPPAPIQPREVRAQSMSSFSMI